MTSSTMGRSHQNAEGATYSGVLREARVVSTRLGMWVLHEVACAEIPIMLVGYIVYHAEDLARRRKAVSHDETRRGVARRRELSRRIIAWRRAGRFVRRISRGEHQALARRLIADLEKENIEYVATSDVDVGGRDPREKIGVPARSTVRRSAFSDVTVCESCGGGMIVR